MIQGTPGGEAESRQTELSLLEMPGRLSRRLRAFSACFLGGSLAIVGVAFYLWRHPQASPLWFWLIVALLVTMGVLIYLAMDCIKTCLHDPLGRVMRWAAEIRQGNLSARVAPGSSDDLTGPVEDINRAAEWLEALALDKERELEHQKTDLERKSRSLQLLFDVATGINHATEVRKLVSRFLYTLADVVGARAASVRLADGEGRFRMVAEVNVEGWMLQAEQLAGTSPELSDIRSGLDLPAILGHLRERGEEVPDSAFQYCLMPVRLQYLDQVKGVYLLFLDRAHGDISDELRELLDSIGRQLGIAVERARLDYEATLLPRMQERALLANELHDSLAQTLASLRFQVRVLDDTLHQGDESAVWTEMERIESSLEEANTELRELIHHFRAPVHRRGLIPAISAAVSRFRKETRIATFFQNQWDDVDVPEEWEVHVQRIVQEALANIRKHSGAENVRVLLSMDAGCYRVLVEDDGEGFVGYADPQKLDEHFGLSIMQERADMVGGELRVESEPGEGTRILLRFGGRDAGPATAKVQ